MSQGITFGAEKDPLWRLKAKNFNLEDEFNSIELDKEQIFNKVSELAAKINPADKKTESLERQIKEIVRLTREFWRLNIVKLTVEESKVSRINIEQVLNKEWTETEATFAEFLDGRVSIDGYFGKEVFFSLFTARNIAGGFPKNERFSNANELQMQLLLCDVIPCYGEKIVLFGKKLEYLDEYQVNNLTVKQIRVIKNANINFSQNSPIFQKINEKTKNITRSEREVPQMEESESCCLLI